MTQLWTRVTKCLRFFWLNETTLKPVLKRLKNPLTLTVCGLYHVTSCFDDDTYFYNIKAMPHIKQNQCGNLRFTLATFAIAYFVTNKLEWSRFILYVIHYVAKGKWKPKQYTYLFHFQFILKVLDGVEMQASQVFPFQTGEIISSWPWFTCIVMLRPQIESTQEYIEKCVHILLAMQCNNLCMSRLYVI